jgi:hypothetical protein
MVGVSEPQGHKPGDAAPVRTTQPTHQKKERP